MWARTDFMSRISAHSSRRRGFTLVELLVATSVAAIVLAGVLSAYLFLGRNLTRLMNTQQQDVQSRRALRNFTSDLSAAIQLSTATSSQLVLTKPKAGGTTTVSYVYAAPSPATAANGTLKRTDNGVERTVLSSLTAFALTYYNEAGTAITPNAQSVKAVEFSYASAAGVASAGTQSAYTTVSPRVVLRNKPVLQ